MQVRNNTITIRLSDEEIKMLIDLTYKFHWNLSGTYTKSDVIRFLIKYADIDKTIENINNRKNNV